MSTEGISPEQEFIMNTIVHRKLEPVLQNKAIGAKVLGRNCIRDEYSTVTKVPATREAPH